VTPPLVSAATWVLAGLFTGWTFAKRPWQQFERPGVVTRLRMWDRRETYERLLFVRAWKDRLPEAGTWFGGISKRSLPDAQDGGLRRFAAESMRAERVHLTLLLVVPLTATWSRGWVLVANVTFGLAINLPCIVVARYNRIRIAHLA
jgi:glycosyl-4,4'-diaponeurosporenoate acyltransferase